MVLLREHQTVRRHRLSRDAGRGDNALLDSFRIFTILRPFRRSQAVFGCISKFVYSISGDILVDPKYSDKIYYAVTHKKSDGF